MPQRAARFARTALRGLRGKRRLGKPQTALSARLRLPMVARGHDDGAVEGWPRPCARPGRRRPGRGCADGFPRPGGRMQRQPPPTSRLRSLCSEVAGRPLDAHNCDQIGVAFVGGMFPGQASMSPCNSLSPNLGPPRISYSGHWLRHAIPSQRHHLGHGRRRSGVLLNER